MHNRGSFGFSASGRGESVLAPEKVDLNQKIEALEKS